MADESKQQGALSEEELEAQSGEALPDREAMSVVWIEPDVVPYEQDSKIDYAVESDSEKDLDPLGGPEQP